MRYEEHKHHDNDALECNVRSCITNSKPDANSKEVLTLHFGGRVVESDPNREKFSKDHVKHKKKDHTRGDGRIVQLWHRSLNDMLQFYVKEFEDQNLSNVNSIEICLGGDHGKGSHSFLGIILIRCLDGKDTHRLEVKLGETNEEKDSIDYLKPLLERTNYGLTGINADDNGNCYMSTDGLKNDAFSKESSSDCVCHVKLFLIGDLKGLFQIVDHNGHNSSCCL